MPSFDAFMVQKRALMRLWFFVMVLLSLFSGKKYCCYDSGVLLYEATIDIIGAYTNACVAIVLLLGRRL